MNTLLWFQRDLRVDDNPALNWALQQQQPVIAVYIHSQKEDTPWAIGAASRWWLHQSLTKLAAALLPYNIELQFINASSVASISQLATDYEIDKVVWTSRVEPQRRICETTIENNLLNQGITVKRFKDELLQHPDAFLTASKDTPYRVFTPFYKKLRAELQLQNHQRSNTAYKHDSLRLAEKLTESVSLEQLELLDAHHWQHKLQQHCSPGAESAYKKLETFINEALPDYVTKRDFPAISATSTLSAHLHFGEISPRQIVDALAPLIEFEGGNAATAAEAFLRQLIWREFARYILWHFPATAVEPMNPKFNTAFWKKDDSSLKLWQRGQTGIAIVDAGMRELWQTGIMHNRVRMLAASLLTKNMGIAWQQGAAWFWDTLVDADLANNSMGWQWVAGCGVDAAPYFRVFNPDTQALKFDKQRTYINHWLNTLKTEALPVIDLASSRNDALYRYNQLIKKNNSVLPQEKKQCP
ncbi:MAG: DNA photolyase family protein [Gammaproteobacteria bacterium]|nr:DNA photolyase family protein [Gammaproteobacteria bacterium]